LLAKVRLPEHLAVTIENFHIIVVVHFEITERQGLNGQETEKEADHETGHDSRVSKV
jgi:hypothetical protein